MSRAIEDAPIELTTVLATVNLVRPLLEQFSYLRCEISLPEDTRLVLASALSTTWTVIIRIQRACKYRGEDVDMKRRLRWAFVEKREVKRLLKELRNAQTGLVFALEPLKL